MERGYPLGMSTQVIIQHESFAPPASPRMEPFRLVAYGVIALAGFLAGFCIGKSQPMRTPAEMRSHSAAPVPHPRSLNTGNWDSR
ncbi:hypothetical protein SAMN05444173_0382 [Opitutus sp. GAS368]|nr:hypothetical protein SAMN05444173_0382 [Opitutus sp. GAS368]